MKTIFTLLVATVFSISVAHAQLQGQIAPDFTLTELNGQSFKLSNNTGKVILVYLLGYNCPLCKAAAPSVKTQLVDKFKSNPNFLAIGIDTWDGSNTGVENFKNSTGLDITYLVKGSSVANSWVTTYDRLVVIDGNRIMSFKGVNGAGSDISKASAAIDIALNKLTTAVGDIESNNTFSLKQNYPNPFSENSRIEFSIKRQANVSLELYNITGKLVSKLIERDYLPGDYSYQFNREGLQSGIYFYKLNAGNTTQAKRMVIR